MYDVVLLAHSWLRWVVVVLWAVVLARSSMALAAKLMGVTAVVVMPETAPAVKVDGARRFGAEVMLDILDGKRSKATQTDFVKDKPIPFPPEPFRFIGIQATRWSLDREDRSGKRNMWLRTLDRFGLGFDS